MLKKLETFISYFRYTSHELLNYLSCVLIETNTFCAILGIPVI